MKTSTKVLLGFTAVTLTTTLIYLTRSLNTRCRLARISNEGYETAHDILYPTKYNRAKRLHYGPVLPVEDPTNEF